MKSEVTIGAILISAGLACGALDASRVRTVQMIGPGDAPSDVGITTLLEPATYTTNINTSGTLMTTSNFYGKARFVVPIVGNDNAGYSATITLRHGATSATNDVATFTHNTPTMECLSTQIVFGADVTLAKFQVVAEVTTGDSEPYSVAAYLIHDSVPSGGYTTTGSAIHRRDMFGSAGSVVFQVGTPGLGSASYSATCYIQDSANGSSGWTNITTLTVSGSTGGVARAAIDLTGNKNYFRAVVVQTNDVAPVAVTFLSF